MKHLIGSLIEIHFLDHCNQSRDVVDCFVRGKIADVLPLHIVIEWWECSLEPETNNEHVSIVTSAIVKYRVLSGVWKCSK